MQRIGLLNGNNITYDKDNTAGNIAVLKPGIFSGFNVSGSGATAEIEPGKAFIKCTRTNLEEIMVFFESTENVAVDMSGTKKVYIEVDQTKIDDGSNNAENGTGVAVITTDPTAYPTKNFVKLYDIVTGTATDDRENIKINDILNLVGLSQNISTTGDITAGDITADNFIGDGSLITNITIDTGKTFTLSENMDAGELVKIINNGEVEKLGFTTNQDYSFNLGDPSYCKSELLSNNKIIITYPDTLNSNNGNAIIGTIYKNTIIFGKEYVFNSSGTNESYPVKINENKIVIVYRDIGLSNHGVAIVGDIEGSSITFGSEYVFQASNNASVSACNLDTDKFFIAYQDGSNSNYGTGLVGTVSGTTISYGTKVVFKTAYSDEIDLLKLDTNKVIIVFRDYTSSLYYGKSRIASVSGTTISYGTEHTFQSSQTQKISIGIISSTKCIISYIDLGAGSFLKSKILDISGTTITSGISYIVEIAPSQNNEAIYLGNNKIIILYYSSGFLKYKVGSFDGTTIIYDTAVVTEVNNPGNPFNCLKIKDNKVLFNFRQSFIGARSLLITYDINNLSGILQESGLATESKRVQLLGGVSNIHSGLTPGDELEYGTTLSATEILLHRYNIL